MAWELLPNAHEIHLNHKENHFLWNFSFKYFAVSIIIHNFAFAFNKEAGWLQITPSGEMVEWSITTVLKTVVPRGAGGSNPSLSANKGVNQRVTWFAPFITPKNVKLGVFILISQKLALHLFVYRLLWLYGIILGTLSPLTYETFSSFLSIFWYDNPHLTFMFKRFTLYK